MKIKRGKIQQLQKMIAARTTMARAVERIEKLTGKGLIDMQIESCLDTCYPGKMRLTPAQAEELLAKIERGEFSPGRARRMRGNGDTHPA